MPESPRYEAKVRGRVDDVVRHLADYSGGQLTADGGDVVGPRLRLGTFLSDRRYLITLIGTAGTWFLVDYAFYGNPISTPQIMTLVSPGASMLMSLVWSLAILVVAAAPGYLLAVRTMDRIGHRRLQSIGFVGLAGAFLLIGALPGLTGMVGPLLVVYAVSYFFTEFGPNTTTFVLPAECFPTSVRATGHGISAAVGKLGAVIGVFVFPILSAHLQPPGHPAAHRCSGLGRPGPDPGPRASQALAGRGVGGGGAGPGPPCRRARDCRRGPGPGLRWPAPRGTPAPGASLSCRDSAILSLPRIPPAAPPGGGSTDCWSGSTGGHEAA